MEKNYKIIRVSPMSFPSIEISLKKKHPDFEHLDYKTQQKLYFKNHFNYSNSFSKGMKELGNESMELIVDCETMQKRWAYEHGIKYKKGQWLLSIFLEQVKYYKPEVMYFQGNHIFSNFDLKEECPSLKILIAYYGFPHNPPGGVDLLIVAVPLLEKWFKAKGFDTRLIYHSFDPHVLEALAEEKFDDKNDRYDFSFVGSSGVGRGAGYFSRYWGLMELLKKTDIKLWLVDLLHKQDIPKIKKKYPKKYTPMQPVLQSVTDSKRCNSPVFGLDMYKVLIQSSLTFNLHPEFAAYTSAGGMRLFEATGVGTCLVSDDAPNIPDLFEKDKEIVTFNSIEECVEKVTYLLEHDKERQKIALAGQKRTLNDHTVNRRCSEIDEIIRQML